MLLYVFWCAEPENVNFCLTYLFLNKIFHFIRCIHRTLYAAVQCRRIKFLSEGSQVFKLNLLDKTKDTATKVLAKYFVNPGKHIEETTEENSN